MIGARPAPACRSLPACAQTADTMLTIDDVAAIPLFSSLPAVDLERLARTSADLHLASGEFAVHEGGEGALFVVLAGKIEVVKTFDGIERRLGWRVPGTLFGEVPLALGSPFPGGYRAVEPSRVSVSTCSSITPSRRCRRRSRRRSARLRASGWAGCRASPPSRRSRA